MSFIGRLAKSIGVEWFAKDNKTFFSSWDQYGYNNDPVWEIGGVEGTAQAVSSLELRFVDPKTKVVIENPNSEQKKWIDSINNPGQLLTRRQLLEMTSMLFDIEGICYWALLDEFGRPVSTVLDAPKNIIAYGPSQITPVYSPYNPDIVSYYMLQTGTGSISMLPFQVIRFWKTNPRSYRDGLRIKDKLGSTIELDNYARGVNKSFFRNGGRPAGTITTSSRVDDEQFKKFVNEVKEKYEGYSNTGKIMGLPYPYNFTPNSLHKDMDFQKLHEMTRDEFFGATRYPKHFMGVNDNINYATAEVLDRVFWMQVVKPKVSIFADVINARLLNDLGLEMEFNFDKVPIIAKDELLVKKEKARIAVYLLKCGYSLNEVNAKLGMGMDEIKEAWANTPHDPSISDGPKPDAEPVSVTVEESKVVKEETHNSPFEKMKASIQNSLKHLLTKEVNKYEHMDLLNAAINGDENSQKAYCDVVEAKTVDPVVDQMDKVITSYFRRLEKSQVDRIKAYAVDHGKAFTRAPEDQNNLDDIERDVEQMLFNVQKWNGILIDDTKSLHLKTYKLSIGLVKDELGGFKLFQDTDNAAAFASSQITSKITRVNDTVRNRLRDLVTNALKNGDTSAQIVNAVQDDFGYSLSRSNLIARQELGNASSKARWDAMSVELEKKIWLDSGDNHVRETHKKYAKLKAKEMDYEYAPGLKFPHDFDAEAAEVMGCRCVIAKGE